MQRNAIFMAREMQCHQDVNLPRIELSKQCNSGKSSNKVIQQAVLKIYMEE